MQKERQKIYLAALLHDIGKFYQRADEPYWESSKLKETSKKLADVICPQNDKGEVTFPTHQHVIWTNDFLENILEEKLGSLCYAVNPFDKRKSNDDNLINLSVYHHRPASPLQGLIQLADHWASGLDRTKKNDEEAQEASKFFKKIPLLSVFSQINKGKETSPFYVNNTYQSLGQGVFPKQEDYEPDYQSMWQDFVDEIKKIPAASDDDTSRNAFVNSLLAVLKSTLRLYRRVLLGQIFLRLVCMTI